MKRILCTATFLFCAVMLCAQTITLPKPQTTGGKPLMEALQARISTRTIAEQPLSMEHISNVLWAALGINRPDGKRTSPTASNNQEIDLYLFLPEGIYLYDPQNHALELKVTGDHRATAARQGAPSGALLVYVADFSRMGRYDDAAKEYYSATDTGFVSQNVYLYCASEGLATVVLGNVNRQAISDILHLQNGKVTLAQPVGYPK